MGCKTSKLSAHDKPMANPSSAAPADLQRQLADKEQQLADKDQQLADKDQQLADKDQQLADKDQQLANKDQQLAHAEEAKAELHRQLADRVHAAAKKKADEAANAAKEKSFNNGLGRQLKRWVRQDTPSESAVVQERPKTSHSY